MRFNDIESTIKTFETVAEIVEVLDKCKSNNCNLFILRLWEEVSVYEFRNELDTHDDTKNYIVLTNIPGYAEDEFVAIVDGVRDLTSFCFEKYEFDRNLLLSKIADGCNSLVQGIKEEYPCISYKDWIEYYPQPEYVGAIGIK